MFFEVKPKLFAKSELEQIVIQRFLGYLDFSSCILQGPSLELDLARPLIRNHDSIVKLSPGADFFDDLRDRSLLGPFLWGFRYWGQSHFHIARTILCRGAIASFVLAVIDASIFRLHDISTTIFSFWLALILTVIIFLLFFLLRLKFFIVFNRL